TGLSPHTPYGPCAAAAGATAPDRYETQRNSSAGDTASQHRTAARHQPTRQPTAARGAERAPRRANRHREPAASERRRAAHRSTVTRTECGPEERNERGGGQIGRHGQDKPAYECSPATTMLTTKKLNVMAE